MRKPRKYKFYARKQVDIGNETIWADPIIIQVMAESRSDAEKFAHEFLEDQSRSLCLVEIEEL